MLLLNVRFCYIEVVFVFSFVFGKKDTVQGMWLFLELTIRDYIFDRSNGEHSFVERYCRLRRL